MKMKLEDVQRIIECLPKESEVALRNNYINKFVDVTKDHYKKYIMTAKEYSDGVCYTGYLWECLINSTLIKFDEVVAYREKLNEVLIFWDIHSKEKIWIDDYWKFGKDTMLRLDYSDFLDNLEFFPEDVYIFDESLMWSLVLTHEDIDGIRICEKIGNI